MSQDKTISRVALARVINMSYSYNVIHPAGMGGSWVIFFLYDKQLRYTVCV